MKRSPRLTRREQRAINGPVRNLGAERAALLRSAQSLPGGPAPQGNPGDHLHCVACGKHLDTLGEARARAAANDLSKLWATLQCEHGSTFYACIACIPKAKEILAEHDRNNSNVRAAPAWH